MNNNLNFQIFNVQKYTPFEETPFATSSGATENHVTVYDTCTIKHVKYHVYTVNLLSFTTETDLFLRTASEIDLC